MDKARVLALRLRLGRSDPAALLRGPDGSTAEHLRALGFSEPMVRRFFRPLFGGILLDPDLATSRRMFDVLFRTLAVGDAAVPVDGMAAIPRQLAARLPAGTVRLATAVRPSSRARSCSTTARGWRGRTSSSPPRVRAAAWLLGDRFPATPQRGPIGGLRVVRRPRAAGAGPPRGARRRRRRAGAEPGRADERGAVVQPRRAGADRRRLPGRARRQGRRRPRRGPGPCGPPPAPRLVRLRGRPVGASAHPSHRLRPARSGPALRAEAPGGGDRRAVGLRRSPRHRLDPGRPVLGATTSRGILAGGGW
ncbi:MAG: FAD-dependent oxidoreductase [Acidimicrobiales bacterium]